MRRARERGKVERQGKAKQLEKLKRKLDVSDKDELLLDLLDEARSAVLLYTNRWAAQWLPSFDAVQLNLAAAAYKRLGAEGYTSRGEGSISTAFADMETLLRPLNRARIVRAV